MRGWTAAALVLVAMAAVRPAAAQTFGFWFDNDIVANRDRYYTNGIQLYYITPERPVVGVDALADLVPGAAAPARRRWGFALGQKMFTPEDLTLNPPDPNDRPYAGWLYGRLSVLTEEPTQVDRFELDVGVVGPWSLAEDTQKFVHRILPSSTYPEGWGSQVRNEPGIVISYQRAWRAERPHRAGPFDVDATPHAAASLGNVYTFAGVGATLRLGQSMPPALGPLIDRPITPIPYQDAVGDGFSWYAYLSLEGRLVGRNIFLDGNTFRDSRSVDKEIAVAAAQLGVTVRFDWAALTVAYNVLTPEFEGQDGLSNYGSFRLAFRF